jgi:hypothetical protein
MQLPNDKQQRIKIAIVAVLATTLVLLGLWQGVLNPLSRSRKAKNARLVECQESIQQAREEIRAAARQFKLNMENVQAIKEVSDKYVLHPILGNYLLGATEIIERQARSLGLQMEPVRETGISEIPSPRSSKAPNALKSYTVRVSLDASYHDVVRFLREIENSNPYVSTVSLAIVGQPETNPEKHKVTFEVQWPIWADPETPSSLQQQTLEKETNL